MDKEILNNLKEDVNGLGWLEGKFESKSLFQGKIDITIMDNTDVAKEYAEKCIAHYNAINNNKELLEKYRKVLQNLCFICMRNGKQWAYMMILQEILNQL